MWPRASLGLRAWAAPHAQILRDATGRSLPLHGHNPCVFQRLARCPGRPSGGRKERQGDACFWVLGRSSIR